jgi:hypothetical protein
MQQQAEIGGGAMIKIDCSKAEYIFCSEIKYGR